MSIILRENDCQRFARMLNENIKIREAQVEQLRAKLEISQCRVAYAKSILVDELFTYGVKRFFNMDRNIATMVRRCADIQWHINQYVDLIGQFRAIAVILGSNPSEYKMMDSVEYELHRLCCPTMKVFTDTDYFPTTEFDKRCEGLDLSCFSKKK
jgi:hypothetical protein